MDTYRFCHVNRLVSGGGAKIQDSFSGLQPHGPNRHHGCLFLYQKPSKKKVRSEWAVFGAYPEAVAGP